MAQPSLALETREVLTFIVAGEHLSLPAGEVAEIIRPRAMTRVPHSPATLVGVTNLRGAVLPIVSLASLLGHAGSAVSAASRIIVVDRGAPVGLLVDSVASLAKHSDDRSIDIGPLLARDFGGLMRRAASTRATGGGQAAAKTIARDEMVLIGFELGGQEFALPLDKVVEVTGLPADIAAIPQTDDAMMGVTAWRGGLLPLVSLHMLLGLPVTDFDAAKARIIVTRMGDAQIGLVVERMKAILRVPTETIDEVPPVLTRGREEAKIDAIARLDGGRRLISILSPARLFDSETAARILADSREGVAEMASSQGVTDSDQFVIFQLGDERYGMPIGAVDEVVRRPDGLTRVPNAPSFVEGVMNLRGKVVPVIDQRQRFAVTGQASGRGRIVIVTIDGLQAGFLVDSVTEVLSIPTDEMQAVPDVTESGASVFDRITTIERDGRMILLVDPKALLDRAERDLLAALAANAAKPESASADDAGPKTRPNRKKAARDS